MSNIRMTSARKTILDYLTENQRHLTAAQIHEALKVRLPSLNLSTVYRSLDYFVEKRLISVADIGQGSPVYEIVSETAHHHLVCLKCGHMIQIDNEAVAPFFEDLKKEFGYEILTNHLVLYGNCPECQD
jgi:Fe2+ or Zn2+ uptake regulation protein